MWPYDVGAENGPEDLYTTKNKMLGKKNLPSPLENVIATLHNHVLIHSWKIVRKWKHSGKKRKEFCRLTTQLRKTRVTGTYMYMDRNYRTRTRKKHGQ